MAIHSGFFNSVGGDRKYDANKFAEYFASFIGNGVFPNPSTGLQVTANDDMTVTVRAGKAWINGYILVNDDDYILTLDPADGVLSRIDRIVAGYDTVDREIRLEVKKGVFASTPAAPALQRDADAYELALADIYVGKGIISITQANITDQRLNTSLCGIVHGTVDQVDTTTLFNQYRNWYDTTTTAEQQEIDDMQLQFQQDWDAWFATVQVALDGDTAGNLLNLINANSAAIATKAEQADLVTINSNVGSLQTDLTAHKAEDASETTKGHIQLATSAEVIAGTSATKAITPVNLKTELDKKMNASENAWEMITDITLANNTAQVDFTNLELENYSLIKLIIEAKSSGTSDTQIFINFNDDMGSNYDHAHIYNNTTATPAYEGGTTNQTKINISTMLAASTKEFGFFDFTITNQEGKHKKLLGNTMSLDTSLTMSYFVGRWRNTSKATKISVIADGASFRTGSTFTLMGVKLVGR